ncbi:cell wall-binding repeat-containing protein [Peptostreptococcus anaerobius]|uniref:cell wall-binding repeat-containing protein n=2 Tax=Peptostreptococcus TaxID=1257 RepID=UPI00254D3849|nr:cell wall-binding repeat-containing protein [Peptostreptococcus anaerobius]
MKKIVSIILSIALVLTYSMSSISLIKAEEVNVPEYEIYIKDHEKKVKLELEMLYKKTGTDKDRAKAKAKLKEQLINIDESKYDWDKIEEVNEEKQDVKYYRGESEGFSIFNFIDTLDNGNSALRGLFEDAMNRLIKIERKSNPIKIPEYEIYVKDHEKKVKLELEMLYKKTGTDKDRAKAKAKLKEQLKNIDESKYDWDKIEEVNEEKQDVKYYRGESEGFSIFNFIDTLDNGNSALRGLFEDAMNRLIKIERNSNPNSETIEEPIVEHIMGTEYSNPIYRTINEKKSEYDKERNNKVYSGFMNKNMDKYLQGGVYGVKVFIKDTYKDNKDIGLYYTIDESDPKIGNNNTAEISRIVRNNEKDYEIINYEYNDQEKFNGYSIIFAKKKEAIKSWIKSLGNSIGKKTNVNELDFPKKLENGGNLVVKIRAINKKTMKSSNIKEIVLPLEKRVLEYNDDKEVEGIKINNENVISGIRPITGSNPLIYYDWNHFQVSDLSKDNKKIMEEFIKKNGIKKLSSAFTLTMRDGEKNISSFAPNIKEEWDLGLHFKNSKKWYEDDVNKSNEELKNKLEKEGKGREYNLRKYKVQAYTIIDGIVVPHMLFKQDDDVISFVSSANTKDGIFNLFLVEQSTQDFKKQVQEYKKTIGKLYREFAESYKNDPEKAGKIKEKYDFDVNNWQDTYDKKGNFSNDLDAQSLISNITDAFNLLIKIKMEYPIKNTSYGWEKMPSNLDEGYYKLPISLKQFVNENDPSMGEKAVNGDAILSVDRDGKKNLYFKADKISARGLQGHLINFWYYKQIEKTSDWKELENPNEFKVHSFSKIETNANQYGTYYTPTLLSMPIDNEYPRKYVRVSVDAMNGNGLISGSTENAILKLDYSKIEKVDKNKFDNTKLDYGKIITAINKGFAIDNDTNSHDKAKLKNLQDQISKTIDFMENKNNIEQKDIDEHLEKLNSALENLNINLNYSKIDKAINDAKALDLNKVEESKKILLNKLIKEAIEIRNSGIKSQKEIDSITDKLNKMIEEINKNNSMENGNKDNDFDEVSVPATMMKYYEDSDSMGNAALTEVIIKKENGTYVYYVKFKGIRITNLYGHLYGLKIYDTDNKSNSIDAEVVKTIRDRDLNGDMREFPQELKFTRDNLDSVINIRVAVDAMDSIGGFDPYKDPNVKWRGAQDARLVLDLSSIKKNKEDLDKPSSSYKEELKKDLAIAEHLLNSGLVNGNSKENLERAIKNAKTILAKKNPSYIDIHGADKILEFAIMGVKNDNSLDDKKKDDAKAVKAYSVPIKLWHAFENKESMGNPAMEKTAIVKEKDGKYEYYISFGGMQFTGMRGHLWGLDVYEAGLNTSLMSASIDKEYTDKGLDGKDRTFPKTYKFIREKKDDKIYVQVSVDAMDAIASNGASSYSTITKGKGKQNAIIMFDWSNAKESTGENQNENIEPSDRISGSNRYETSVNISKKYFKKADTVVLASGINSADALVSASYAKLNASPILLTNKNSIESSVESEIERLGAKNIHIVGGTGSVSSSIENRLANKGYKVERIAGANRFETSSLLAAKVSKKANSKKVIIINGVKDADALSVSSLATKENAPVFMVESNNIRPSIKKKINDMNAEELLVIGGTGSISNNVVEQLNVATKRRIAGANRYETAIKIANESYPKANLYMLANGYNAIDALSAGAVTSKAKSPILLVEKYRIPNSVKNLIDGKATTILGGENTISNIR